MPGVDPPAITDRHNPPLRVSLGAQGDGVPRSLDEMAKAVSMDVVDVQYQGWPDGLLRDHRGRAWRVAPVEAGDCAVVTLVTANDLALELTRLLGSGVRVDVAEAELPALDLPQICVVCLPGLRTPVLIDVAGAVATLATLPHEGMHQDVGRVLLAMDRAGVVWPCVEPAGPG